VAVAADRAVSLPENTSFAEGACLGIPALTAYGAVFGDGDISGQTVLVTGGAGAVGHYAVQMAKLAGARQVIATVSSESKAKLAAATDAGAVINYRTDDVAARGMEVTGGHGVDRIIEVEFGGNLAASLALLRAGGTIATYASEAVPEPSVPFYSMLYKSIRVEHILVFQLAEELKHAACADITRWLSAGELIHQVGPQFPLADTIAAHQAVENHAQGKVIVLPRGAND
jgi:NADPH2:quinone reductase